MRSSSRSTDNKPLLLGGGSSHKCGSFFAATNGHSVSPEGLASIVSERQLGALKALGGVQGILNEILCSSASNNNPTFSSSLKDGSLDNNNDNDSGSSASSGVIDILSCRCRTNGLCHCHQNPICGSSLCWRPQRQNDKTSCG